MQIPDKLKIGGYTFEVIRENRAEHGDNHRLPFAYCVWLREVNLYAGILGSM
jgi:hypothetical protein